MTINLRPATSEDADICGQIGYEAFKAIADQHNFAPDFPTAHIAITIYRSLLQHRGFYKVVAESDGRVVGSNFLHEGAIIGGIGPITVDPTVQNQQIGRRLMTDVMDRAERQQMPGIRLVQTAYHNRSLSLYTKLGFDPREPLSTFQGRPPAVQIPGRNVRPATTSDGPACNRLCRRIHGFERAAELAEAIERGIASVVEYGGRITGYATAVAIFAHAVAETNDDLKALIAAARSYEGPGFLVPTRNAELMRWCLEHRLRVVQPMTLMSIGLYNEPAGAYLPSVLY